MGDWWRCRVTWTGGGFTDGDGTTKEEAERNLALNVANDRVNNNSMIFVIIKSIISASLTKIVAFGLIISLSIFGFPGKAYADWHCRLLSPSDPTNFNNFLGEGFGIYQDEAKTAALNDCLKRNSREGCSLGSPSCRETRPPIIVPTQGSGYFLLGGTKYFRDKTTICGFASPNHFEWFKKGTPARDEKISTIDSYTYKGACPFPSGYFNDGRTTYFSSVGNFCGFPSAAAYASHRRSHPGEAPLGTIDIDPTKILKYTGAC